MAGPRRRKFSLWLSRYFCHWCTLVNTYAAAQCTLEVGGSVRGQGGQRTEEIMYVNVLVLPKNVNFISSVVFYKRYISGTDKWKRRTEQTPYIRKECSFPCLLQAHHPPRTSMCSPAWKLSVPSVGNFLKERLHHVGMTD